MLFNIINKIKRKHRWPLWKTMEIELHSFCNRDCVWCPRHNDRSGIRKEENGYKVRKQMPTNKVYDLLNEASGLKFKGIVRFHRLSEALWDERFIDFVRYARGKDMQPWENTNGDPLRENPELCHALDGLLASLTIGLYDYENEKEKQNEMKYWKEQFKKTKIKFSLPRERCWIRQKIDLSPQMKKDPRWLNSPCIHPMDCIQIRYDGEVMLCSEDDYCNFDLGNVFQKKLEEIWWDSKRLEICNMLKNPGGRHKFELCSKCYWGQVAITPFRE